MNESTKALREQMGQDAKIIRAMADKINAENRDFTPEELEAWNKVNDAYTAKERRLDILAKADAVEGKISAHADRSRSVAAGVAQISDGATLMPTEQVKAAAFGAWMRSQGGFDVSDAERQAAASIGVNLSSPTFIVNRPLGMQSNALWEARGGVHDFGANLSQYDPTKGGVLTTPDSLVRSMERALLQFGGVRQVAQIMTTSTGEPMTWPAADDTSNQGSQIGESDSQTTTTTTNPSFKAKTWYAYGYTSNFILVPFGLLRDSAFNIAEIVGSMLGERVGRKTASHFATGDGAAKPSGIVPDSTAGVTAASATAVAADELFDLVHSIDPAYRSMGCGWMMHDTILKGIRKLKDGNGQYLWQEGISVGVPNMLLGYPYTICQEMQSSFASATKTILFGLLSAYKIRDVGGVRLNRVNERFIETDNVGFNVISYHDGHLLNAGTNPVKHLVQA